LKKIVVIGPESTGKSFLCEQLARHYNTVWVKEYAREYLLKNGTDYTFEALLDIAKGQVAEEESGIGNWEAANLKPQTSNLKPLFILNRIAERKYDLYLLCNTDLPWVKDELREYPDLETREKLFRHYKDILVNQNVPWVNISGGYEERLQKAITAVDRLIL